MEKEEIAKAIRRTEIVREWYSEMTGGEYTVNSIKAYELIRQLEEVDKNGKE